MMGEWTLYPDCAGVLIIWWLTLITRQKTLELNERPYERGGLRLIVAWLRFFVGDLTPLTLGCRYALGDGLQPLVNPHRSLVASRREEGCSELRRFILGSGLCAESHIAFSYN